MNLINKTEELKLDVLLEKNLLIVNSDDCAMWKTGSLSENILLVLKDYNWGIEELEKMERNAINFTFLNTEEK